MKKIEIPKHIDFKPRKDIEHCFERINTGFVSVEFPESSYCQCKKEKFIWQEKCYECRKKENKI